MFDPREKIALFIDGANLYATAKSLGFDIDYKRLLEEFQGKGYLLRAYYYTALAEDQEYSSIRPLIDWLDYNGYTVVTKPTKEFVDASGRRKIKGNMDIELAVHVMEMAEYVDHFVLFSGDGDFRSLVEAVQRKGRKVSVISTLVDPAADDRRRAAPPGGPFRRPRDAAVEDRPRPGRARRSARPSGSRRPPSRTSSRTTTSSEPRRLIGMEPTSRAATARSARGWSPFARSGGAAEPRGTTRRCRPSARLTPAC